jgi:hypothetical protein
MKTFGNESRFVNLDMSLILMYKRIYTLSTKMFMIIQRADILCEISLSLIFVQSSTYRIRMKHWCIIQILYSS